MTPCLSGYDHSPVLSSGGVSGQVLALFGFAGESRPAAHLQFQAVFKAIHPDFPLRISRRFMSDAMFDA
jgi:hypothetical protein